MSVPFLLLHGLVCVQRTTLLDCSPVSFGLCQATIHWDLSVVGWDVTYGADFEPTDGYSTIIEKGRKITTADEPIHTVFPSPGAGKVRISIDNSASKRKKTVVYRYLIKDAANKTA